MPCHRIQRTERFVKQQQGRFRRECPSPTHALPLASGKLVRKTFPKLL
jgi:hypothetical protein